MVTCIVLLCFIKLGIISYIASLENDLIFNFTVATAPFEVRPTPLPGVNCCSLLVIVTHCLSTFEGFLTFNKVYQQRANTGIEPLTSFSACGLPHHNVYVV